MSFYYWQIDNVFDDAINKCMHMSASKNVFSSLLAISIESHAFQWDEIAHITIIAKIRINGKNKTYHMHACFIEKERDKLFHGVKHYGCLFSNSIAFAISHFPSFLSLEWLISWRLCHSLPRKKDLSWLFKR
jgi:hypothetical protein